MIDQVRELAIYAERPDEFVLLDVNGQELRDQLAQVRKCQEEMLMKNGVAI